MKVSCPVLRGREVSQGPPATRLFGYLGQNPEIRYTPTGLPVVNFSVATDDVYVDKDGKRQTRVEWHRVVVIGKLALTCNEYLKKGRQVFVEGRLRNREFESKADGRKQRRTEIIGIRIEFLGAPPAGKMDIADDADSSLLIETEIPF